jgi:hypothetical protein
MIVIIKLVICKTLFYSSLKLQREIVNSELLQKHLTSITGKKYFKKQINLYENIKLIK